MKKFYAVIGNPPYQGDNHMQLYPDFYLSGQQIANCVELIFPTGWQEPKNGNNLKKMNTKEVKEDKQIVFIDNVHNAFPNMPSVEWTNIVMWKKGYDNGLNGSQRLLTDGENEQTIKLLCNANEIVLPEQLQSIIQKVKNDEFESIVSIIYIQNNLCLDTVYADYPDLRAKISSGGKDRRFESNIFDKLEAFTETQNSNSDIHTVGIVGGKRVWRYIDPKYVDLNHANLYKHKLIVAGAASSEFGSCLSDFIFGKPQDAFTRSFISFGASDNKKEIENIATYLKTKFARALLFSLKTSQHNNANTWANVPLQDFTKKSDIDWSLSIPEIDEELFKKYKLTQKEKAYINKNVKEMT